MKAEKMTPEEIQSQYSNAAKEPIIKSFTEAELHELVLCVSLIIQGLVKKPNTVQTNLDALLAHKLITLLTPNEEWAMNQDMCESATDTIIAHLKKETPEEKHNSIRAELIARLLSIGDD
jgi:hypothetical protein